jgi:ABC-2 type transport system permease protein
MNSFLQLTQFQLRSMMRNKIAFFFNLCMPLIFLVFFGMIYGPKEAHIPAVGLVDLDQGKAAEQLRFYLSAQSVFPLQMGTEAELTAKLSNGKLDTIIRLEPGLSAQVSAGQGPAQVTLLYDETNQNAQAAVGFVRGLLNAYGTRPVLIATPTPLPGKPKLDVLDYTMPGTLLQMLMSAGLLTVAIWLANQRQSGAMRHLFSTPLKISAWVASRITANLLLAALQAGLLFGIAAALFAVSGPANLVGSVLFLVLCALATLGMGMLVGVLAPSADAAFPLAMILYMGLIFLGGAMFPLQMAPPVFQTIAKWAPTYYMTDGLGAVMRNGESLAAIWPHLLIVGGVALITISIATWRIRKQFIEA